MAFRLEGGVPGTLRLGDKWGEEGKASEASVTPKPQAALAPARAEDSEQVPAGAGRAVAPAAPAAWGSVGQKLEPLLWGTLDEVQRHNRVPSDKRIRYLGLSSGFEASEMGQEGGWRPVVAEPWSPQGWVPGGPVHRVPRMGTPDC